jgi:hypothetical protein
LTGNTTSNNSTQPLANIVTMASYSIEVPVSSGTVDAVHVDDVACCENEIQVCVCLFVSLNLFHFYRFLTIVAQVNNNTLMR